MGTRIKQNYIRCNETQTGHQKGCKSFNRYDTESIMHYRPNPFSRHPTNKNTLAFTLTDKAKDMCGEAGCNPGQRDEFSTLDLEDMYKLYSNETHTCGK